jgi:hypothetical protein
MMNSCGDPVPFLADHRMHNLPELRALMRLGDHTIETVPFEIRLLLTIVLLSFLPDQGGISCSGSSAFELRSFVGLR